MTLLFVLLIKKHQLQQKSTIIISSEIYHLYFDRLDQKHTLTLVVVFKEAVPCIFQAHTVKYHLDL